jgi:hypothetical protein
MGANSSSLNHSPEGGAKLTHRQIRHFRRETKCSLPFPRSYTLPNTDYYLLSVDNKEIKQQYQTLLKHFPSGKFNKDDYRNAKNATVDDDIMVEFWFDICDTDGNGIIDVKEFLCAQSVLSKGSLEDKVEGKYYPVFVVVLSQSSLTLRIFLAISSRTKH